ncbi:mRNA cleavage and polyadenylation factor subunit, partial [Coemansia aciculifera]
MRDPIYTFCRELVPPSSVDRACGLSFTRAGSSNLALARGNVLEVYKIELVPYHSDTPSTSGNGGDDYVYGEQHSGEEFDLPMIQDNANNGGSSRPANEQSQKANKTKRPQMHLVGRWRLHGKIMDMQAVRGNEHGIENLVVSFSEAKMAVVSFCAATQSIVTESIHYYEHEQLQHTMRNSDAVSCALRGDPEGRCVVLRIYDDQLAVLPLNEVAENGGEGRAFGDSYVVDMRATSNIRSIHDCVFLSGYLEPTLALLHEPDAMWAGTLDASVDSCCVTVVSLDLARRSASTINSVGRLPYDSRTLVAVPAPIGGVLVVSSSALTHVANGAVSCIAVLSKAAARGIGCSAADAIDRTSEGLGLVLDPRQCAWAFVAPAAAVLWTQHGLCLQLALHTDGRSAVRRIAATLVAGSAKPEPAADAWDDVGVVPSCVAELRVAYDDDDD